MKTFSKIAIALVALAGLSFGQTILSTTTLGAAVTTATCSDVTIQVASSSTMQGLGTLNQPQTIIYVDKELGFVKSVTDSTHIVAQRCKGVGMSGRPQTHANGATVWFSNSSGNTPAAQIGFKNEQPNAEVSGSCTAANIIGLPLIYEWSGNKYDCLGSLWVQTNAPGVPTLATGVTAPAGVMTPTATVMITDTGTNAVTGIAVPNGAGPGFTITLIPGGAFTTTNATNIRIASTAVVGKALIMTWDGSKWDPSY